MDEQTQRDLEEAIRHSRAGLKALEAAQQLLSSSGKLYTTHLHLSAVEMAHAIEIALKAALRNQ